MKKYLIQVVVYCLVSCLAVGQTIEQDFSFGENGFIAFNAVETIIHDIQVQTNGKIIVFGSGFVYRFDIDGQPDTTFADNGVWDITPEIDTTGGCTQPNIMALLSGDNHIVILDHCPDSMLHLVTYDIQNDTTTHLWANVSVDGYYCDMKAISDTQIALSQAHNNTIIIVDIFDNEINMMDSGMPVPNGGCSASLHYGHSNLYARRSHNTVVNPTEDMVLYITKIGDDTFGENGIYTESFDGVVAGVPYNARKLLIQSDGKILYTGKETGLLTKRLTPNGIPDANFNPVPLPLAGASDGSIFQDIALASDDEIFVGLNSAWGGAYIIHYDENGNERGIAGITPSGTHIDVSYVIPQQNESVLVWSLVINSSGDILHEITKLAPPLGGANFVSGNVFNDLNFSCTKDSIDYGLENWLVKLEGPSHTTYDITNSLGDYHMSVPGEGEFAVSVVPPGYLWGVACPEVAVISVEADSSTTTLVDFALEHIIFCPLLEVDISTPIVRRCFETNYHIQYCNNGTATAEDAYIEVQLDPYFTYLNSQIPGTDIGDNLYAFDLGDVGVSQCGGFYVTVYVDCDSTVLGQTHCVEAHIYPDSICAPISSIWDGASIDVDAQCLGDSIEFRITNIGGGDMSDSLEYLVVEDDLIWQRANFQLDSGESFVFQEAANSIFHRLETEQSPGHPGSSMPSVFVEGCGINVGEIGTSFVNYYVLDEGNTFVSIDCQQNVGSYDPNDKQAFPVGYGAPHYITDSTDLEYMIRFQNTGTDTAFNIVIRDTISSHLNIETLRPGVASHDYRYDIEESNIAVFHFENIMLPDSNVNEAASHGFIKFNIEQQRDNPIGTHIMNDAAIYFDFNEPIITNTVFHTVGEDFMGVVTSIVTPPEVEEAGISVNIFPNPFNEYTRFEVEGETVKELHLSVYDMVGRKILQQQSTHQQHITMKRNNLTPGIYVFRLMDERKQLATGKLVIE